MNTKSRILIAFFALALVLPGFSRQNTTVQPKTEVKEETQGLKKISSAKGLNFDVRIDHNALESSIASALREALRSVDVAMEELEELEINIEPIKINLKDLDLKLEPIVINLSKLDIYIEPIEIDDFDIDIADEDFNDHQWNENEDEDWHHEKDHDKIKDKHKSDKDKSDKAKDKSSKEEKDKTKGLKKIN